MPIDTADVPELITALAKRLKSHGIEYRAALIIVAEMLSVELDKTFQVDVR